MVVCLEKVLPVFKTGLAGDADYVLDVYPKKGNYYIIRQTSGKPVMPELTNAEEESKKKNLWTRFLDWVDSIQDENVNNSQDDTDKKHEKLKPETFTGAAALVKVLDYNSSSKQIKFRILTAIGGDVIRNKDGKVDVSKMTYETDKNDRIYDFREETLDYNKWSALDPMMVEADALPEDAKYDPDKEEDNLNPEPNPQPRKRITPVFKKTLTDDKGEEVEEFIFGMDIDDNEGRSIEPAKSYTEDTALYDSAVNEADDSSTGSTDSSTDSNTSDSTNQNTSNIKNIIVVKKFPDETYQINAIVLNNKVSFEEFKNALGSDFAEVNDDAITKDIIGQAKSKGYIGQQNLEIEDISKFSESLKKLETQKSNYENTTSEVDKIAEQIGNFISNTDELKDFKHLTRWEFIGRDINRAAYFWCKFNSKPAYSATFPLMASSGDASYFFRIWLVAIGAITTQAKDASADASAGNNQPTHQISTFNPHRILMMIYFGNNKNFQINPKQQGARAIEMLMSLHQVKINLAEDNTEKIKEGLTNVLQEAKKNNIITDSIKVSYISDNRMTESNSSSVNILRNIDEGKLKYAHEYFVLSKTAWNDGNIKNPSEYLKENMKFLVSKTKDEINKILKENVSVQLRPFSKSDKYKARLPHNRNGLMTSGNTLYESVSIVHFAKTGIIDKVYNIGIKEIKF